MLVKGWVAEHLGKEHQEQRRADQGGREGFNDKAVDGLPPGDGGGIRAVQWADGVHGLLCNAEIDSPIVATVQPGTNAPCGCVFTIGNPVPLIGGIVAKRFPNVASNPLQQ